jgi:peptidoglycan/xylan/chitin deacetylase (PgdA/CDA1 family)
VIRRVGRKVLAAAYLYCGWVQVRNWVRRRRGRVPGIVVNFHRVADDRLDHWMTMSTPAFGAYLDQIASRYRVVSLEEMVRRLASGSNREPLVAITFDDGYRQCAEGAARELAARRMTAAFFVCSGFVDRQADFEHDRERGILSLPKMGTHELKGLVERGFEVGSHSISHVDFRFADADSIHREIADSKTDLERATGVPVRGFAVPYGSRAHCRPEVFAEARKAGYAYVLSHFDGANFPGQETSHLRRVRPPLDSGLLMRAAVEGWRGLSGLFRPFDPYDDPAPGGTS